MSESNSNGRSEADAAESKPEASSAPAQAASEAAPEPTPEAKSEPKPEPPAAHPPVPPPPGSKLVLLRRGLSIGGVAFVALVLLVTMSGGGGASGALTSAVLWGAAAVCFLASFVVYLMEPAPPPATPEKKRSAPVATATSPATSTSDTATVTATETVTTDSAAAPAPDEERSAKPLIRRGNPLRWLRGGTTALAGGFLALLLMSRQGQLRWGVPMGVVLVLVAAWGVMDLLGTFDDPPDRVEHSTTVRELAAPVGGFLAATLVFLLALGAASAGVTISGSERISQLVWGLLVTVSFVGCVAAVFEVGRRLGAWAKDETGEERPLWKRHGFWVVVAAAALYFPMMGSYSLWDPWETHYGEVAREMLARDDWISLWWAQDGWFWSKPVLDMWMQAIAMTTLGVHYMPDKMLSTDGGSAAAMHPEWAVRAPVVLLTILAMYLLYKGVARTFGRRAALLGALVLATMPDWFFIAHQTMTDMPCIGAMTACMGLVMIGLRTPEDREARLYELRPLGLRFSGWHLVMGAVLVCAIPQILYLLSRNFELVWHPGAHGFRPHWDEFHSGSGGGNCGLPGNEECRPTMPASIPQSVRGNDLSVGAAAWRTIGAFEPALQAVVWLLVLAALLYMTWGERRVRRLYYLGAWFFAAISTLGKGPMGVALPVAVTLTYLAASRPGEDFFTRIRRVIAELTHFEIVAGLILIVPLVALPWYVAMYVRHGSPFTDRLIFHDMFNRAFHHVHDTNEGDDTSFRFYVWQLGYALFPWTGLAPLGLLWWLRRGTSEEDRARADTSVLLCMWFVFGFALFSFMGTKFHHYIFPAVPPVAMLVGVVLDDMIANKPVAQRGTLPAYLAGVGGGAALMVLGVARLVPGSIFGVKPDGHLGDPSRIGVLLIGAGVVMVGLFVWLFRAKGDTPPQAQDEDASESHASRVLAAGAVAAAFVLVLVARDLIIKPEGADQPGAIRLLHLFTYNYRRQWPDSLDFSAALTGFGVVAVVAMLALTVRAIRQHAVVAACAFAFVWALWGVDVYMTKTAPHWGQHEVIAAYYADRKSPDEILVAYQMNWKGENFYTGNRVPAFVSTGSNFTNWMKKKRDEGVTVMYFVTEHGRIGGLKGEVGGKNYREVTTKELCNKFVLVRAEL